MHPRWKICHVLTFTEYLKERCYTPNNTLLMLIMTDEPESPPCRSWLLFLEAGLSTAWCWTLTIRESCITAHQSAQKLICQPLRRDKSLSLTIGSVMEGPAWWRELHQAFLCWSKLWEGNESSGHVTKTPGDSGWVDGGGVSMWPGMANMDRLLLWMHICSCSSFIAFAVTCVANTIYIFADTYGAFAWSDVTGRDGDELTQGEGEEMAGGPEKLQTAGCKWVRLCIRAHSDETLRPLEGQWLVSLKSLMSTFLQRPQAIFHLKLKLAQCGLSCDFLQ